MAKVDLKGVHAVNSNGRRYYYAWRGGPRIHAEPGTDAFNEAYAAAIAERHAPDPRRFRAMVVAYKASPAYAALADSTRRNWAPWLDRISDHFGGLSTAAFDRTTKIRPLIRKWRAKFAATPRAADYGMQVLSRVLSHAVESGDLESNACEGIKSLYCGNRADVIWTDEDIAALEASAEVMHVVQLAACTGLRLGDVLRLSWSHVGANDIVMVTGKSGKRRREAVIPIYKQLRAVLEAIPRRSPVILTSTRGGPWTKDGFGSSFNKAKKDTRPDLHFHDLRGTAATRFYLGGLSARVIAEIMGWEEDSVERIIRRYVGRQAATLEVIRKLDGGT